MPLYKPSELATYLDSLGIRPKKGLSQNFLLDGNIIRKIVESAGVSKESLVMEVGPGPGALTEALLGTGAHILAIEKDRALAAALKTHPDFDQKRLDVCCEDILTFPFEEKLREHTSFDPEKRCQLVANLPYHLTTPIMTRFIPRTDLFSSVTVMVQDEVAKRFVAKPGTKEYGAITLFLNFYSTPHYAFKVSSHCFYPKPKVDSAVVVFNLKQPPAGVDRESFFKLTRTAFSQRRKMLTSSLGKLYAKDSIKDALAAQNLLPTARPEELSLEQFLALYKTL